MTARAALTTLIGRWQGRESLPSGAEVAGSLVVAEAGGGFTLHHRQGEGYDGLTVIDPAGARYRQFDSAGAFGEEIGAVAAEGTAIVMTRGETRATFAADGDTLRFTTRTSVEGQGAAQLPGLPPSVEVQASFTGVGSGRLALSRRDGGEHREERLVLTSTLRAPSPTGSPDGLTVDVSSTTTTRSARRPR